MKRNGDGMEELDGWRDGTGKETRMAFFSIPLFFLKKHTSVMTHTQGSL